MAERGPIELWGGVECTLARIGDDVRDQVRETGHRERDDDLDRIAGLGIRTLRYPVLWETVTPALGDRPDWAWHDRRLARLRERGIRPIVGLVHHGSGPRGTDLLDRDFPWRLARHAAAVARRYPWIDAYTPVNEPLTTARFAALYGHWYPHRRSLGDFLRALVNQCRATVLAMRAIRRVTPGARLVQTEDLGRVFSTTALAYQADHENERRWLTFDLLFGRVDRTHPWHRILLDHGLPERDLKLFQLGEVVPDLVGINHYLTSDRYLDERLDRYPAHLTGGNGRDRYADVEAVRVPLPRDALGVRARLEEAWTRYRAPIAVTEVHHGCTRDEQLRWLAEVWRDAEAARRAGADIRAVTAWALFGAVDWNSLLTRREGIYEPGPFDIRGPGARPTALAAAVGSIARTGRFRHPVLDGPGWWRRDGRFYQPEAATPAAPPLRTSRLLAVRGPDGPLRRAILRLAAVRGLDVEVMPGSEMPLPVGRAWAVVEVGRVVERPVRSVGRRAEPAEGVPLMRICSLPFLLGQSGRELAESDTRGFLERPDALVVVPGALFGPWDDDSAVSPIAAALVAGQPVPGDCDRPASWSYLPDLVHVALDLLIDGERGVRHLVNSPAASLREVARLMADRLGATLRLSDEPPPQPSAPPLATEFGQLLPDLESALDRWLQARAENLRDQAGTWPAAAA